MIKGCSKRVIVMKNTGHEMIEEAFFILSPDAAKGKTGEGDILKQANSILESSGMPTSFSSFSLNVNAKKKPRHSVTDFLWGVVAGITATCILMLIAG